MAMQSLNSCISSVDFSCRTLEASNAALAAETGDMRRLADALRSKRHFDLVSETDIRSVRDHLAAEIAPQLKELIVRAEEALQGEERKAKTLRAKAAQQNSHLEHLAQQHDVTLDQLRRAVHQKVTRTESEDANPSPTEHSQRDAVDAETMSERLRSMQIRRKTLQEELDMLEGKVP